MNILLLRGLSREHRHWGSFPQELQSFLAKSRPGSTVMTLDFAGFGTEVQRVSPTSISEIMKDARERFQELKKNFQGSWMIVAPSLGGMVLMEWTNAYPKDFEKGIIINSSLRGLNPIHHRFQMHNVSTLYKLILKRPNYFTQEYEILKMTTNLNEEGLQERARIQSGFFPKPDRKNGVRQLWAAMKFKAPKNVPIPLLVISSLGDTLVNPDCSVRIAEYYGLPHVIHPTANHDLPTDDPKWLMQELLKWV